MTDDEIDLILGTNENMVALLKKMLDKLLSLATSPRVCMIIIDHDPQMIARSVSGNEHVDQVGSPLLRYFFVSQPAAFKLAAHFWFVGMN